MVQIPRGRLAGSYCWWFVRNPGSTHHLRLVDYPIIYKVWDTSQVGFRHQQYDPLKLPKKICDKFGCHKFGTPKSSISSINSMDCAMFFWSIRVFWSTMNRWLNDDAWRILKRCSMQLVQMRWNPPTKKIHANFMATFFVRLSAFKVESLKSVHFPVREGKLWFQKFNLNNIKHESFI